MPGLECVGAVVRSPRDLPVPTYRSLAECVAGAAPDFVVTAVSWQAGPGLIVEAVERGLPVLAETPRRRTSPGCGSCGPPSARPGWCRWPSSTC
nr:hypothetical protein GCM10020092_047830 [Actinoplanes digitatis]